MLGVTLKHSAAHPIVEIAWSATAGVYALFGVMFIVGLATLATHLHRMRIFEAIKLGETL